MTSTDVWYEGFNSPKVVTSLCTGSISTAFQVHSHKCVQLYCPSEHFSKKKQNTVC